jgi:hypothetical protein
LLLLNLQVNKVLQQHSKILLLFTILILSTFVTGGYFYRQSPFRFVSSSAAAQTEEEDEHNERKNGDNFLPTVNDPNLKVEQVFEGLRFPTKMAF